MDLGAWLTARRASFDAHCDELFVDAWPEPFAEPLRYPVFGGGKRFRPMLALAAYEAVADDPADLTHVLPAAAAVELVHTYSLVHDDLPCMDDDDERRGRPTVHVAFGEDTAVLVGDALLTEAFAVLARSPGSAETRIQMVHRLAEAAGYRGMVGGQAADVAATAEVDLDTLLHIHACKTGALITASSVLGGLAAGADADQLGRLQRYGRDVGLAFQLADDVLDADEDAAADGPPSFVKLLGLEATHDRAATLAQEAIDAVRPLARPEALIALARYCIERTT
jgi:geranylgeranyl pyrophosphate synthase